MWNKQIKRTFLIFITAYFIYQFVALWVKEEGRIFEWFFFADSNYHKTLEEQTYVMTGNEIAIYLSNPNQPFIQKTKDELKKGMRTTQDLFVLIRIIHKPEKVPPSYGKFFYQVNDRDKTLVEVEMGGSPQLNEIWIRSVDPGFIFSKESPSIPNVKVSWLQIYHK